MKVLISDYDGTLYVNENDLKKNIKKISKFREKGNIFIISTARNYSSIKEECLKNDIKTDYFFCDIGATILDFDGNLLYTHYIEKNSIEKIEGILENRYSELTVNRYGIHGLKEKGEKGIVEYKIKGSQETLLRLKRIIDKEIKKVKTQITEDNRFIIHTDTKEKAIEIFTEKMGLDNNIVYTVGDELDDLEMLEKYNGYRMQNCNYLVNQNIQKKVKSVSELIDLIDE